jgi:hypothetical protein
MKTLKFSNLELKHEKVFQSKILMKKGDEQTRMSLSSTIPQTPRDKSPKRCIKNWKVLLKFKKVRIKNYLYFLIFKALKRRNWSILEWRLAEEGSKQIRQQLPDLYCVITYLLLNMKDQKENWQNVNFLFNKNQDWIPNNLKRAAYGTGGGNIVDLLLIEDELQTSSEALCGNLVLLELGVEEDTRPVVLPIFKRGYNDHGSCVPDHKKGRNLGASREPDPLYSKVGDNPNEDVEFLELIGTSEFFHFLDRQKEE